MREDQYEDKFFCPSCWDRRTDPAPGRCARPESHHPATAVKIGVVIEHADGTKTHLATEDFDAVDIDINRGVPDFRTIGHHNRPDIVISIRNVRKYVMLKPQPPQPPQIDDGTIVEEGS